jgi:hypothetical protein
MNARAQSRSTAGFHIRWKVTNGSSKTTYLDAIDRHANYLALVIPSASYSFLNFSLSTRCFFFPRYLGHITLLSTRVSFRRMLNSVVQTLLGIYQAVMTGNRICSKLDKLYRGGERRAACTSRTILTHAAPPRFGGKCDAR